MSSDKIRPSRWWYGLSAVIVIISFMCFWILLVSLFIGLKNRTQQIVVPGTHRLELATSGDYIIYHEYQSVVGDKTFSRKQKIIPGLKCSVHSVDGTEEIMVSSIAPDSTYAFGKREAVSILKFKIQHPGTYILTAEYSNGRETPRIVLGILKDRPMKPSVVAISTGLLSIPMILLPACIFWVTFFKRRKAKKQLAAKNA